MQELLRRGLTLTPQPQKPKWYSPHSPTTKQRDFLSLQCLEALYGGAAGGGKSDALLMAALQYVHVPGYAALILRRTFADLALPGAIMDRAKHWLIGGEARWNDNTRTFTFPSGATLTFGYLQTEGDKFRYQGAELQFIAFDELTQFTETQYTYLFSRLRRKAGVRVPLRMRSASNPGGVGHDWVKQRFIDPETNEGRVFVPASRRENPHVDNDAYDLALASLDPTTRKQLDDGDWDVLPPGDIFKAEWFAGKSVTEDELPADLTYCLFWDTAATEPSPQNTDPDWTAGVLVGATPRRNAFYIANVFRWRKGPGETERLIVQTCYEMRDWCAARKATLSVGLEEEGGASGKMAAYTLTTALSGFHVLPVKSTGSKAVRARPASTQAQNGNVYYVKGHWNRAFLGELYAFTGEDGGVHDDQVDGFSGSFNVLAGVRPTTIQPAAPRINTAKTYTPGLRI